MIEYYLGEKPALAQVPTWICAERAQRDYVLDNLAELVVKPIDGFGGTGVVIGPEASDRCAGGPSARTADPTRALHRPGGDRAVHPPDIRRGGHVPAPRRPARVRAPAARARRYGDGARHAGRADPGRARGSRIVNSSSGGGSKDTWILDRRPTRPSGAVGNGRQHVRYLRRDPLRRAVGRRRRGDPDDGRHGVPRPRFRRRRRARPDRARPSATVDHRPVRPRRPADGRQRPRADAGVQRLHLQLPGAARRARSRWLPVLLRLPTAKS